MYGNTANPEDSTMARSPEVTSISALLNEILHILAVD